MTKHFSSQLIELNTIGRYFRKKFKESVYKVPISISGFTCPNIDGTVTKGGCTFCDKCANACEHEVLNLEFKKNIDAKISIDMIECMSWNQTMCFSCKDPCLDDAINFLAMFRPEIDNNKCTSCGFCIKYCPVGAIKIS